MKPRLRLFTGFRSILRAQAICQAAKPVFCRSLQSRWITSDEKPLPTTEQSKGPNQEQSPHVSEEAAAINKSMGETGPDLTRGTPVQEILERDSGGQEKAPKVLQDEIKKSSGPAGSRSFSTSVARSLGAVELTSSPGGMEPPPLLTFRDISHNMGGVGHKFGLPDTPLARTDHLKRRYHPVVDQLTKALMRDGKLSAAQRTVADILDTLRTAPPPQQKSNKPGQALLPSAGPHNLLPLSPIDYLTSVFDSLAPLVKIRQQKGLAGGGQSLPIPMPIGVKTRRRAAIRWILDSAEKRTEVRLADRVSREIINIAEGTSSAWEKRQAVHKSAVTARVNVKAMLMGSRRK